MNRLFDFIEELFQKVGGWILSRPFWMQWFLYVSVAFMAGWTYMNLMRDLYRWFIS